MKVKKIKNVKEKEFDDIYHGKFKQEEHWKHLFNDTLKQIDNFSSSTSFWYVADFRDGVVAAGGDCEIATPLHKKEWIGLQPQDIGQMFHPLDVSKMRAFVVFMAGFLANKKDTERKKIKISLVFRMLNAQQNYTWRIMEYPAMHYVKNEPRYLLCQVSEINHLVNDPKCMMYILDASEKEPTMYYCDEENINLKLLYPKKPLSSREIEVVKLLVKGLISKEIGEVLNISKNTVENHKQNIYMKTGTKKINELIAFASKYIVN